MSFKSIKHILDNFWHNSCDKGMAEKISFHLRINLSQFYIACFVSVSFLIFHFSSFISNWPPVELSDCQTYGRLSLLVVFMLVFLQDFQGWVCERINTLMIFLYSLYNDPVLRDKSHCFQISSVCSKNEQLH